MKRSEVLFLCTGNYYRSRFAEHVFNHLAEGRQLDWRAYSRGLAIELVDSRAGPISPHTRAGLAERGISLGSGVRGPIALAEDDLERADHIVALKRQEHWPLLSRRFPRWVDRVEFWQVDDVDCASPVKALPQIEVLVVGLLGRLAR